MPALLSPFERQPPELLLCLVPFLNLEDYMSLGCTSKRFRRVLEDEGMFEIIGNQHLKYSPEIQLAKEGVVKYSKAVRRAFSRKQALALGRPYSVVTLGYGTSFFYKDGVLCYLAGQRIRFLNVFDSDTIEKVIDTTFIVHLVEGVLGNGLETGIIAILYHSHGLLSLSFGHGSHMRVASIEIGTVGHQGQMLMMMVPWSPRVSVIRSDSRYVLTATYTGTSVTPGNHPRHDWQIQYTERYHHGGPGISSTEDAWSSILQLRNFFGVDLGQTVVFELFDGYLYAVSNQSTFEVEEVDWTSYYHCWRINLGEGSRSSWLHKRRPIRHKRVWRRQHREGVINDNWTDLSLHKDEKTGIVTIVEARKEYLGLSSEAVRTFYSQPLLFDDAEPSNVIEIFSSPTLVIVAPDLSNATTSPYSASHPAGDVLARTLGKDDLPNYEEPPIRIPLNCHIESPAPANTLKPLASAYKFRTYVPSSAASLDLIQRAGKDEPSFRISSRYLASPIDANTQLLRPLLYDDNYQKLVKDSELVYTNRPMVIWPHPDVPPLMREVLNPQSSGTPDPTRAMADSRSLVYTSGAPHGSLGQAITMVNFDKSINFERSIPSLSPAPKRAYTFMDAETDIGVTEMREKMDVWRRGVRSEAAWTTGGEKWMGWAEGMASWTWYEKAWVFRGVGGEYIVRRDIIDDHGGKRLRRLKIADGGRGSE